MGMYTELVLKAQVRVNVPENVAAVLNYLFNREGDLPDVGRLPDHPFFSCSRWTCIGKMGRYSEGYILSRSDLKNYDQEIENFIDWVTPYLDVLPGECIGWSWYEEESAPTLLYMSEKAHG